MELEAEVQPVVLVIHQLDDLVIQSHLLLGSHSVLPFTEAEPIGLAHVKGQHISAQLRNSSAVRWWLALRISGGLALGWGAGTLSSSLSLWLLFR